MNSVFFKKDFYLRFADGKICGFGGIKIFLSVTALLFFATFFCVATDYKWKGSSSGIWGDAGNWNIIDENLEKNSIAEVFMKGYKKGDKVIRHSVVKVAN